MFVVDWNKVYSINPLWTFSSSKSETVETQTQMFRIFSSRAETRKPKITLQLDLEQRDLELEQNNKLASLYGSDDFSALRHSRAPCEHYQLLIVNIAP